MRFSENWLRQWVNPDINSTTLSAQLTMAGMEVSALTSVCPAFSQVVIGQVIEVKQHPNADRLQVCTVNWGDQNPPLQIVCGAKNVCVGGKYPVALVGAQLPGGVSIGCSKLRGVESQGMLCSAKELELGEDQAGIYALAADAPIGISLQVYLELNDHAIEVELTPNRGDCLSIEGMAREVAMINGLTLTPPKMCTIAEQHQQQFPVYVDQSDACPRYVARLIKNIDLSVSAPIWLHECLRRSGLRSIDPVVDVTNYVMLELGQPLHAFDLDCLQDEVRIRLAKPGEEIALLNGQTASLTPQTLLITDAQGPLVIAGIMGGERSSISASTKDLFLECAFFSPLAIAGRARHYGLHTDASHRYERGVDPQLPYRAIQRASELLLEIVGGQAGPIIDCTDESQLPQVASINLRLQRIERILGIFIEKQAVENILTGLGMTWCHLPSSEVQTGWRVSPPSYRFDIDIEEDLIEEIARIYGYQNIAAQTLDFAGKQPQSTQCKLSDRAIQQCLLGRDYQEAITYSFVDPHLQDLFLSKLKPIPIQNPISNEMSVMRCSLWPGLLQAAIYNKNRQQSRIRLFETGLRFYQQTNETVQQLMLAGIITGAACREAWHEKTRPLDFFDIKGDIEALLQLTGKPEAFTFQPSHLESLHPGQSAELIKEGKTLGHFGALHPQIKKKLKFQEPIFLFELTLEGILDKKRPRFDEISKFPANRRDLSLIVDKSVTASDLKSLVYRVGGGLLKEILIFDVYQGDGIATEQKSVALGLTLQHSERTLTDNEMVEVIDRIVTTLKKEINATLRD